MTTSSRKDVRVPEGKDDAAEPDRTGAAPASAHPLRTDEIAALQGDVWDAEVESWGDTIEARDEPDATPPPGDVAPVALTPLPLSASSAPSPPAQPDGAEPDEIVIVDDSRPLLIPDLDTLASGELLVTPADAHRSGKAFDSAPAETRSGGAPSPDDPDAPWPVNPPEDPADVLLQPQNIDGDEAEPWMEEPPLDEPIESLDATAALDWNPERLLGALALPYEAPPAYPSDAHLEERADLHAD